MSESFSIRSSTGTYQVRIEAGLFSESLARSEGRILADEFFRSRVDELYPGSIFLKADESEKSLERMPSLIDQLRSSGAGRTTHLIAVGGGVVQDISAFLASIYMRGMVWSYIPTTVLAMVDSCIGGKSSINVGLYKNLVGTFHPPQEILIDPTLIRSLPSEQVASGLVEAAKICFCCGPKSFSRYLACQPSVHLEGEPLEEVIRCSLLAKKHFIEVDEFDQKERLLLNFGHTFGHAIEGASDYSIPHGIAVALGILCSFEFQAQAGIRHEAGSGVDQFRQHLLSLLRSAPRLNEKIGRLKITDVMKRFAADKKHTSEAYTLILVSGAGDVCLERHSRTAGTEQRISKAIEQMIASYTS